MQTPVKSVCIEAKAGLPTGLETKISETNIAINVEVTKKTNEEVRNMGLETMAEESIQELEWHTG